MPNLSDISAQLEALQQETGERMLKYFAFKHLPVGTLQTRSADFADLACKIVNWTPSNAERTAGLRKLLEAKDCIVRANLE